jgi:hypothetical protein
MKNRPRLPAHACLTTVDNLISEVLGITAGGEVAVVDKDFSAKGVGK